MEADTEKSDATYQTCQVLLLSFKRERVQESDEKMLLSDNDDTRRLFEQCQLKAKMVVNPIIDWTDRDIWKFIRGEHLNVNSLYQMSYDRVGCIGCPIAGRRTRWREFADFPQYKQAYIRAFDKMIRIREARGLETRWRSGEEVFVWWMEDQNIKGQMTLYDIGMM